ncbi:major facilitator superfamily transporter [Niveomyces insectorum RCEF 264]|uniref:Major facilitator superfamily transporter n=1 Tax=Niveomyces insectorum RCEF 264 TaxID=1081102 RepID=A0A167Y1A8_9HYPO|nr:major facilitator superfamily transporter [Niveomyces insectorum RCEF 264]
MAPSHRIVVQEMPPEFPMPLDTETELWNHPTRDEKTGSIKAPSDTTSTEKPPLDRVDTSATVSEDEHPLEVVGSTDIYDGEGRIRLIPTPTPNAKDPLNLPNWRKYVAIGSLCFFGSLSMCADMVVGGLLPVFLLEYSGVDPRPILKHADMKGNPSPLALIPPGVKPVSLYEVTLLSSLPMLTNCVASFALVPMSLAIGRRPVLLLTAMLSWIGGFWAGFSTSLHEHLCARVVHGLGSATVEALLPLVMQDIVFIHQRNRAIAAILACQGPMMAVFGVLGPYIAVNYTWRWLYFITSGACVLAWILLICFVPETRVVRSKQELNGIQIWPVEDGANRTAINYEKYGKRTLRDDIGMFNNGYEWKEAIIQTLRALQVTYFPAVLLVILIDAVFFIILQSMGQTIPFALLAAGVPYELSGLTILTSLVSSVIIYFFGGPFADKLTLKISRMRGTTAREPEYQLPNLVVPLLSSMAGCAVYGCASKFHWHFAFLLVGSFFLMIGSLTATTILKTFSIESYPQWPGPVLVSVNTMRTVISFGFSSYASTWVNDRGALFVFGVYIAILFAVSGFIPVFFFFGRRFRQWTSGRIKVRPEEFISSVRTAAAPDIEVPENSSTTAFASGLARTETNGRPGPTRTTTIGSIDKTLSRVMTTETAETANAANGGKGKHSSTTVTVKEEL